ncbi:MAG: hypothetical protein V4559_08925 [Pseudomonadota bacterium]
MSEGLANGSLPYHINEHVHRFAAWAASRAASTSTLRFSVAKGKDIIEVARLRELSSGPDRLPQPEGMNAYHKQWRARVIEAAQSNGLVFSHGIAAKLINTYLKAALVTTAYHGDPRIGALHPPIDRVLLDGLASSGLGSKSFWRTMRDVGWSNFSSEQYEDVIGAISKLQEETERPLWAIEEHWRGYQ